MGVFINEDDVGGLMHGFGHAAQHGQTPFIRRHFIGGAQAVEVIIEKALRALDKLFEGGAAGGLDETVRVMGSGHHGDPYGQPGRQQTIQRPDGGILSRFI